jgi:diguanylate cyclase (GGDEF)-like protein
MKGGAFLTVTRDMAVDMTAEKWIYRPISVGVFIAVCLLYSVSGWLGIYGAGMGDGSLTLVWLPSGLGLVACLFYGPWIWPALWLGSFVSNVPFLLGVETSSVVSSLVTGAIGASINTVVQCLFAFVLFKHFIRVPALDSTQRMIAFVFKVIMLPSVLNIGLLILLYSMAGFVQYEDGFTFSGLMVKWLSGALADFHGYFIVVPLALSLAAYISQYELAPGGECLKADAKKAVLLLFNRRNTVAFSGFLLVLSFSVFWLDTTIYLLASVGVLVALYLGMLSSAVFVTTTSLTLTFATAQGFGPFVYASSWESFLSLLMYVFGFGFPIYLLAAKNQELSLAFSDMENKVEKRTQALYEANAKLENMSLTDGLTGIPNRRFLDQCLKDEWARALRHHRTLSVMMVDIDCFKQFNDHYGHLKGDDALKNVAQALREVCQRSSDVVARYGGEEFMLVLPDTVDVKSKAQDCLSVVRALQIPHHYSNVLEVLTVSVGYCSVIPEAGESLESLVDAADQALYQAKHEGRNRAFESAFQHV